MTDMTDETWPTTQECAEHKYEGVPPCPVWFCPNGHDEQTYVAVLGVRLGTADASKPGVERIFLRAWVRVDGKRAFYWRELIEAGHTRHTRPISDGEINESFDVGKGMLGNAGI